MANLQMVRNKNIKFLIWFNFLTLLIFYFGPGEYDYENGIATFIYVVTNLVFIYVGTRVDVGFIKHDLLHFRNKKYNLNLIVFLASILVYPLVCSRLGVTSLNPILVFQKIQQGLYNPGMGYSEKISLIESYNGPRSFLRTFNFILSPFTFLLLPVGLFYWRFLNNLCRGMFVLFICLDLFGWLAVGTNKGLIDLVFTILFTLLIKKPNFFRFKLSTLFLLMFFFLFGIGMFLRTTTSRFENSLGDINYESIGGDMRIKNSGIYSELDFESKFALSLIGGYLSQGYSALDKSLGEEFIGSYGFGNSWFLVDLYKVIFNEDILPRTYVGGILKSKGIDPQINWHTAYVWLAGDLTFWGVPFVLFFLGVLYNYFIKSVYYNYLDIISLMSLFLISNVFLYLFANNQIMSFAFFPLFTFTTLAVWRYVKVRR